MTMTETEKPASEKPKGGRAPKSEPTELPTVRYGQLASFDGSIRVPLVVGDAKDVRKGQTVNAKSNKGRVKSVKVTTVVATIDGTSLAQYVKA